MKWMLNIGFGELTVLLLIAFVVVGPNDLPKVARAVARAIKYIKRLTGNMMSSIGLDEELADIKEVKKTVDEAVDPQKILSPVKQEITDVTKTVKSVVKDDLNKKI